MKKILVLNGPNLNMLGKREQTIYGSLSLLDIETMIIQKASTLSLDVKCFQSNAEHLLIEKVHACFGIVDFVIINPAGYTHTSVALRDALLAINVPFIEVHLSNIHHREPFRHHSYFSDKAIGVICGLGEQGYVYALDYAHSYLNKSS